MSKKTPEQAAEEFIDYIIDSQCDMNYKLAFLAGRKHFIENELKNILMEALLVSFAKETGKDSSLMRQDSFEEEADEIVKKIKED